MFATLPNIPTKTKLGLLDFKVALVAANDPTGQVKYKNHIAESKTTP